ncbi:hypothetical protein RB195_004502 [Necator americanus]|uniref:Uncharacterized protein n=1 Tax=Necator americanus TaxID=51031 RepID=A0ABR1BLT1_NECAM
MSGCSKRLRSWTKATHAALVMETTSDCVSTTREQSPQNLLLGAAERIKLNVIALQVTNIRRDVRQIIDGTHVNRGEKVPLRNGGGVGFVVQPSVVHLVDFSCHLVWQLFASGLSGKAC